MSTAPALWRSRGVAAWLLWPLSLLFRVVSALRRAAFRAGLLRADRLPVPVIVVGNIIAGGAGKTPLTLYLARALAERGWRPLIVTRGYGGRADAVHEVGTQADFAESGDEPVLLARCSGLPVWVGRRRADAARAGLTAHPECDLVLCDDGMQHYALARDIEVAVLDRRGVMNGFHLPAGPLREPIARLRTVDAVVLNGLPAAPGDVRATFRMRLLENVSISSMRPNGRRWRPICAACACMRSPASVSRRASSITCARSDSSSSRIPFPITTPTRRRTLFSRTATHCC